MKHLLKGVAFAALFALAVTAVWGQEPPKLPPVDFTWMAQTNHPFAPGVVPGIPILPPEFDKAGVLVSIKNCDGCTKYEVKVTYRRLSTDPGVFLGDPITLPVAADIFPRMENPNGDRTYAVLWLGKTRADHQVLKVEVEALAVVARSEQTPK